MEKGILGRVACSFHGGAAAHYVSFLILTRGKACVAVKAKKASAVDVPACLVRCLHSIK